MSKWNKRTQAERIFILLYLGLKSVKKFQVWLLDKKENHFTARLTKIDANISLMSSRVDI